MSPYYSDADISRQIAARQRQAIVDAQQGKFYDRPVPLSKPSPNRDDDAEEETQMQRQARLHREATTPPSAPTASSEDRSPEVPSVPPAYRPENQPRPRKPAKHGTTKVGLARRAAEDSSVNKCGVKGCGLETHSFSHTCLKHLIRRRRYGSARLTRHPMEFRDYRHLLIPARRYLRRNKPPTAILEAMASFLRPADALPFDRVGKKKRALLRVEMQWWGDARAKIKDQHHGRCDYSAFGHLAHMVAVCAYLEEHESGFPDRADLHALMRSLVMRHKRPGRYVVSKKQWREAGPGIVKGKKRGSLISSTVVKGLIRRYQQKDRGDLRLFVALAARDVLALVKSHPKMRRPVPSPAKSSPPIIRRLPTVTAPVLKTLSLEADDIFNSKPSKPVPTVASIIASIYAKDMPLDVLKAEFEALPVPPEPGPRYVIPEPYNYWVQDIGHQRREREWNEASKLHTDYRMLKDAFDSVYKEVVPE